MQPLRINLCYHPTTIVFLDDHQPFLKALQLNFSGVFPCRFYYDSREALSFFTEQYHASPFIERSFADDNELLTDHLLQNINTRNIHKEIYNPQRFNEISVIVVDYNMPGINGLEFSRLIKKSQPLIKIMMLTGEADQTLAVSAFNDGIINKFIMKSAQDFTATLTQAIIDLQQQYFVELSEKCCSTVSQFKDNLSCLTDPVFIEFFTQLYQRNQLVEYYLMDNQGSFLFLNSQGKPSWLAVKNETDMENFYQYASLEQASASVIEALNARTGILYFHTDADLKTPPQQWANYLHSAHKLIGKDTYYYAYITQSPCYDVQSAKIVSYQQYINFRD